MRPTRRQTWLHGRLQANLSKDFPAHPSQQEGTCATPHPVTSLCAPEERQGLTQNGEVPRSERHSIAVLAFVGRQAGKCAQIAAGYAGAAHYAGRNLLDHGRRGMSNMYKAKLLTECSIR